jgi:hypothetical protein
LISTNNVAWYPFISLLLASCQEPGEGDCSISPKQVSRKNPRVLIVINRRCELRSPILLAVPTACDRGDVSLSRPEFGSATVGATTLSSYALLGAFLGVLHPESSAPSLLAAPAPTACDRRRCGRVVPNTSHQASASVGSTSMLTYVTRSLVDAEEPFISTT